MPPDLFHYIKVKENGTCKTQTAWTWKFLVVLIKESNQDTKHKQQILTQREQRWSNRGLRYVTWGCSHVDSPRFVLDIFFNRTPSLDPVLLFTVTPNKFKTSNLSWGCYARGPSTSGGNDELHRCFFLFSYRTAAKKTRAKKWTNKHTRHEAFKFK